MHRKPLLFSRPAPSLEDSPMPRTLFPLVALVLLFGVVTLAQAMPDEYICESISYPDGTQGTAVVRVDEDRLLRVDYYSDQKGEFLGRYEDTTGGDEYPRNQQEAVVFAQAHYF